MKVAVVTAYFDAITRGDLDGLEEIVTDDYVFVTPQETGDVASVDDGRGRLVLRDGKIARAEMLV
jgi:ketosteroid isomerase-like protein